MSSTKTSDGKRKVVTGKGSSKPQIVATSQTSRFHVDTLTTLSTEIDLHTVNVSIGQNDLLVDAHLRLKAGVHYALIGRNGEGKSTLLKAIAERLIPGISDNLRLLLVSQVEDNDTTSSQPLAGETEGATFDTELTVTERVVKSDKRRERALAEQKTLQYAHDTSTNITNIAKALFTVKLQRAKDDLEEAHKVALRRSGARGIQARKDLLKAEAAVVELEQRLENGDWGISDSQITLEAAEMLDAVQNYLDAIDAGTAEARARTILLGLGFKKEQLDAKFTTLSGGWRSRCSLANALLQNPDILMLDEPTNYLDILSVTWLQKHLETVTSTVVVIAHDREFVDAIAQETFILRNKTLTYYDGNLTEYEQDMRVERKGKIRMKEALDKKRVAMEKTIEQGMRAAKATGDTNRAKMAKSRQKKLDERWGMERSAKGGRFKLNRDNAGYHFSNREEIEIEALDKPINLVIPKPESLRFPGSLISATSISFSYPRMTTKVLDDVSITIYPGDRVGLVGKNGEGKSTLVKLLTGIGGLVPKQGTIERHPRLRLGYFDQHSVEALSSADAIGTPALRYFLDTLQNLSPPVDVDEAAARACLGSFGLHGRTAINPIGSLSGGQKVRLALAIVVYPAPNLLVLDEVTTHLDKDTIVALIRALRKYTGAVLLVSHDRHFVRCVIEGEPAVPRSGDDTEEESDNEDEEDDDTGQAKRGMVFAVGPKGRVKSLAGGMDDYAVVIEKQMRKLGLA